MTKISTRPIGAGLIRSRLLRLSAAVCAILGVGPASAAETASGLSRIMDIYLADIPQHRLAGTRLKLEAPARENTDAVEPGKSRMWSTVTKIVSRQYTIDPQSGQILATGLAEATGQLASFAIRLKVRNGAVVQSETLFNERTGPFDAENLARPDVIFDAVIPVERRATREELAKIAYRYFEALGTGNSKVAPFDQRCDRYESGQKMTNNPRYAQGGSEEARDAALESCAGTVDLMNAAHGWGGTPERRFPIIDVERGVAVGYCFILRTDGRVLYLVEKFKIVDHAIRQIDAFSMFLEKPPASGFPADNPQPQ